MVRTVGHKARTDSHSKRSSSIKMKSSNPSRSSSDKDRRLSALGCQLILYEVRFSRLSTMPGCRSNAAKTSDLSFLLHRHTSCPRFDWRTRISCNIRLPAPMFSELLFNKPVFSASLPASPQIPDQSVLSQSTTLTLRDSLNRL